MTEYNRSKYFDIYDHQSLESPLYFVWIDLEMTGLDIYNDKIMEIACVVTDTSFGSIATMGNIVIHVEDSVLDSMDDWGRTTHGRNGLIDECKASNVTCAEAERQVIAFIESVVSEPKRALIAGNSVHIDREFLMREMPDLVRMLSYRILDVSSIGAVIEAWFPEAWEKRPKKSDAHRALPDILESIAELKWYHSVLGSRALT